MGTADESRVCLLQIAFATAIDFVGRSAAREGNIRISSKTPSI
ncbi:hypothetical protein RCH11_001736 [Glaciihabitans sp. GrIS 2.15]|nr:hypothetical protein [Glaciihabitans sp. GrIS 2.15]